MDPLEVFKSLGFNVKEVPQAKEYIHVTISPQQGGPQLELVKPQRDSKFFILGMVIGVHEFHQEQLRSMVAEDRREFLAKLRYQLLKMKVDVGTSPPEKEIPQIVFVSRILYDEELTENDVLNAMYKVRNAGMLTIFMFADRFGVPQPTNKYM
ncbi:MAG: DUF2299 domain-containing protein [Metallosphaera sp.]|uniref:DUF2299 domain-containing protein n=1 Tax=Metallosphaera cuprina (strain Ar-4) TaxID=1006006 RepID=F4G2C9_METCR|nr:DUF2299 domain-containing protein [Metallosphaera cuprina]AEB94977.1 conserved hypothetical protein [Metallosphaera cuprina Ar-4]